ncbi:MAG: 2-succinyl-5-enolpyruvyl-6-hydroxy-3-cyclohexene-1-carboxylic-acid synthase [Austwickia sp.]|nr:2-succinyl-5-enolpyruvyl-6-hydroxy-3-cyclohexene-1-carboxylic-acid synthase [Austwickia sp.]MBK8436131.1 2-succinyl-5-enolpyruvyl-6-hydroxy-3-cyclohexene-1-carboxylic-acid synthase [Austwickia sp.]MBK9101810.1 2-succinyl-5-enolpyruvyl-6-hydroxy-3-cyclohexene-1-carboxylic-acid synthase [Austwickia sp.]
MLAVCLASVLVDELVRCGVTDAVLSPGSRSAPLAYALAAAEEEGRLRLHVRVDERVAAFVALGLAKATGRVVPVVTTSGTAVANLHPAVLEADAAGVPLLVLSADRPPELRGTGANQTADQVKLFGAAVRWWHELGTPEGGRPLETQAAAWRTAVDRAVSAALGFSGRPGPVHLNVPLREPLAPDPAATPVPAGRPGGAPWTELRIPSAPVGSVVDSVAGSVALGEEPRTLVVLGDLTGVGGKSTLGAGLTQAYRTVFGWAAQAGYPVLAEPFGPRDVSGPGALPHGPLLAAVPDLIADLAPRRIVLAGRLTLSRPVAALLRRPDTEIVVAGGGGRWADPSHVAHRVVDLMGLVAGAGDPPEGESEWSAAWRRAGEGVHAAVAPALARDFPAGPAVAAAVLDALPQGARLFLGASAAPRDVEVARDVDGVDVWASRGLAGIDGCLSTAVGMALAAPGVPTYALVGDLTFLHDGNALMIGPGEAVPDLTVVVVNDDGGSIFGTLEYGDPARLAYDGARGVMRRVFTTPTGTDLAARCAAHGASHTSVASAQALAEVLAWPPTGVRVVEVDARGVDRRGSEATLNALAEAALRGSS